MLKSQLWRESCAAVQKRCVVVKRYPAWSPRGAHGPVKVSQLSWLPWQLLGLLELCRYQTPQKPALKMTICIHITAHILSCCNQWQKKNWPGQICGNINTTVVGNPNWQQPRLNRTKPPCFLSLIAWYNSAALFYCTCQRPIILPWGRAIRAVLALGWSAWKKLNGTLMGLGTGIQRKQAAQENLTQPRIAVACPLI